MDRPLESEDGESASFKSLLSAYQKQSSSYISFMLTASLPPFPYQYLLFSINLFRSLKKKNDSRECHKKKALKKRSAIKESRGTF